METKLLRAIAVAMLTSIDGPGKWHKKDERQKFKEIDNPLLGLHVGDTVHSYSEDDEAMVEERVLAVVDGVGYMFANYYTDGPTLAPIDSEAYALTREDAIELWRPTIESDLEFVQKRADNLPGLKLLLGKLDTTS